MRLSAVKKFVEDLIAAGGGGGGGGGFAVGPWEDVFNVGQPSPGMFPVDPTTLTFPADDKPWEFWMKFTRTAAGNNGFALLDIDSGAPYAANNDEMSNSNQGELRGVVPAGAAVQLYPSGDTSTLAIDFIFRRTFGS